MSDWLKKVAEAEVPALQYTEGGPWCLCLNVTVKDLALHIGAETLHAFIRNYRQELGSGPFDLWLFEVGKNGKLKEGVRWIDAQNSPSERKPLSKDSDHRRGSR